MSLLNGSVSGGRQLKVIRERRGVNQFDLELSEVITQANYSKIERGLSIPTRPKLEAILDALKANFNERQEVLKSFGYLPSYPLPELDEIEAACQRCQPVLDTVPMPAYLMDFVTRLFAWNASFAKLLGVYEQSGVLNQLCHMPLFKAQFDSRVRLAKFIANIDLHIEAQSIRDRLSAYRDERWYENFITTLCQEPEFHKYWQKTKDTIQRDEPVTEFAARILQPVKFDVPGLETQLQVHFYANHDPLIGDDRFRIVYLVPADAFTIRQVDRWLAEV